MRVVGLALLCAGCAGDVFYVHESFTALEVQAIRQGVSAWEIAIDDRIPIEFGARFDPHHPGCQNIIARVRYGDSLLPGKAVGSSANRTCSYQIALAYDLIGDHPDQWTSVVIHEFGHYFGLRHAGDRRAAMYPNLIKNPPTCVTTLDADAYTAATGAPAEGCPLAP